MRMFEHQTHMIARSLVPLDSTVVLYSNSNHRINLNPSISFIKACIGVGHHTFTYPFLFFLIFTCTSHSKHYIQVSIVINHQN
jgi:hypothetical protein